MIENNYNLNIYDLSIGKDFLIDKTTQAIKDKIDKPDNTKIKNDYETENSTIKVKRQAKKPKQNRKKM